MECPYCKDPDAYVGIIHVECPNPNCDHFSSKVLEEKLKDSEGGFASLFEAYGVDPDDVLEYYRETDDYYAYLLSTLVKTDLPI